MNIFLLVMYDCNSVARLCAQTTEVCGMGITSSIFKCRFCGKFMCG